MRLRNRRYSWLEPEKKLTIDKVSAEMRSNFTSIEITKPLELKDEDPTSVEWATTNLRQGDHIRFKVILYKNSIKY